MLRVLAVTVSAIAAAASPGGAITNGQPDEGRHPYVGGTVIFFEQHNETIVNCTGSLISPKVFLTAAHCGRDGDSEVSFDEDFDPEKSTRFKGTFIAHPSFDPAHLTKNDIAVIVLEDPVPGVVESKLPRLPERGLLDRMKADRTLNQQTKFTSVGYGFQGFTTGPGGPEPISGQRRSFSVGSYSALDPDQLHLLQTTATDDGGTCWGDSGGPNFLGAGQGETLIIAGLTSTGDTHCKATNVTYRLDTENAQEFLGEYVELPPSG